MIQGQLYIDGIDIYERFGIFSVEGGTKGLIAYPPLKTPDYNDWHEEDGIEADLSNPCLDSRDVTLSLADSKFHNGYVEFIEMLADRQVHEFDFSQLGRKYKLRLTQQPQSLTHIRDLGCFTLRFTDDYPSLNLPEEELQTYPLQQPQYDWEIDDYPLYKLGILVLEGSETEVYKHAATKSPLVRDLSVIEGRLVDEDAPVTFQTKELKIKCLIYCPVEYLWNNYDEFLRRLVLPGEHRFDSAAVGEEFKGYYKSCVVEDFRYLPGNPWLQFTVTLVATSGMRVTDDLLLCSESGEWIITEDQPEDYDRDYVLIKSSSSTKEMEVEEIKG